MWDSGISYALSGASTAPDKEIIRENIVERFSALPGKPTYLTFPGNNWLTEKAIADRRKTLKLQPGKFVCLEYSSHIYREALANKPPNVDAQLLHVELHKYFSKVDFVLPFKVDAAWFDLIGPMTQKRFQVASALWNTQLGSYLAITSRRGRWAGGDPYKKRLSKDGYPGLILRKELTRHKVVYEVEKYPGRYSVRMHHIVFEKIHEQEKTI
jgi:hypothetical protein